MISRSGNAAPEILIFHHPLAGIQLVKGTVEPAENLTNAARRELFKESGLFARAPLSFKSKSAQITPHQAWLVYHLSLTCKQNQWTHFAQDDGGIELQFFWHARQAPPPPNCGAIYARLLNDALPQLLKQLQL